MRRLKYFTQLLILSFLATACGNNAGSEEPAATDSSGGDGASADPATPHSTSEEAPNSAANPAQPAGPDEPADWVASIDAHMAAIAEAEDPWAENCERIRAIQTALESGADEFQERVGFFEDHTRLRAQVRRNISFCDQGRRFIPPTGAQSQTGDETPDSVGLGATWARVKQAFESAE